MFYSCKGRIVSLQINVFTTSQCIPYCGTDTLGIEGRAIILCGGWLCPVIMAWCDNTLGWIEVALITTDLSFLLAIWSFLCFVWGIVKSYHLTVGSHFDLLPPLNTGSPSWFNVSEVSIYSRWHTSDLKAIREPPESFLKIHVSTSQLLSYYITFSLHLILKNYLSDLSIQV